MADRRLGGVDSKTREELLDAAEQLMLEEGYAAVTSRRVGRKAGISPQLVHYYFRTMDDLFLAVFRRRAEEGLARFEEALKIAPTLRTIWYVGRDTPGANFNLEFAALANHRKAIRAEMAGYAERFRNMQLEAARSVLERYRGFPADVPPEAALLAMMGISQLMAIEQTLGISGGHDTTLEFIEHYLDQLEATRTSTSPRPRERSHT